MALNQRHYESLVGLVPARRFQGLWQLNPAALTSNYNNSVRISTGSGWTGRTGAWMADSIWTPAPTTACSIKWVLILFRKCCTASNYDAEFGRSASATINVVTKSGGNQYHGGFFEFVQNNDFNAKNPGTKLTNPTATGYAAVPPFHFKQLGWDVGGPIPFLQPKASCFSSPGGVEEVSRGLSGINGCLGAGNLSDGDGSHRQLHGRL